MDTLSKEERSLHMSRIRSKNTRPELYIRKLLFSKGYRYRLHKKELPGKPDLWLKKFNTAIFIHGCFWHRHENCKLAYFPKSNTDFWQKKFDSNVARDRKVRQELSEKGIRILIIWECTIRKMQADPEFKSRKLEAITSFLGSDLDYEEI